MALSAEILALMAPLQQPLHAIGRSSTDLVGDVIEWDVETWSRCLPFWAPVLASISPGSTTVLTLGERHGGLTLWFALHGYRVICTDYRGPTDRAKKLHRTYGVDSRIRYAGASVLSLPFPPESFAIVAAKSVIGGLKSDPRDRASRTIETMHLATNEIHRVLRPGGYFLGAENMVGSMVHRGGRRMRHGQNLGWRHLTIAEIDRLFDRYADVEQQHHGFIGSHWRESALNKWSSRIDQLICPRLPAASKYVGFIRARK